MTVPGFANPVFDSQAAFRSILRAMSRPGEIVPAGAALTPPAPLHLAAAAALLTLADFETPLWLSQAFAGGEAGDWLTFHTGAPRADTAQAAAFALVQADELDLTGCAQGLAAYPDRSTTIIVQVGDLTNSGDLVLCGPGVKGERRLGFPARPAGFLDQWRMNSESFPLGVGLILAAADSLAALPRSTRIVGGG